MSRSKPPKVTFGATISSPLYDLTKWNGIQPEERRDYDDGVTITRDMIGPYRAKQATQYVTIWNRFEGTSAGYLIIRDEDGYGLSRARMLFRNGARTRVGAELINFDGKGRFLTAEGKLA